MNTRNSDTITALSAYLILNANRENGKTQEEIAEEFKVSRAAVSRWLRSHPGFKKAIRPVYPYGYWFDPAEPAPLKAEPPKTESSKAEPPKVESPKTDCSKAGCSLVNYEAVNKFYSMGPDAQLDLIKKAGNRLVEIGSEKASLSDNRKLLINFCSALLFRLQER